MAMKIPLLVLPAVILVVVVACHSLLSKSRATAHTRSGVLSRDSVRGKWKVNSVQEVHHLSESPLNKRKYIHKHTELPHLSIPSVHSMPRQISTFGKSNIISSNPSGTLRQRDRPQLLKGKSIKQIAEDARRRYQNNRPLPVVRISRPKGPLKTDTFSRNKDKPQNKSRHSVQNSPHLRNWSRAIKKLDHSSLISALSRYNYISLYEKWYKTNGLPQLYRDYYKYRPYRRKHVVRRSVARRGVLNTIMAISRGDVSKNYHNYRQERMRSLLDFLTSPLIQKPRNTVTSSEPSTFVKAASTTETKAKGIQAHERLPSPVSLPQVTLQDNNNNMDALTTAELRGGPLQNHKGYNVNQSTYKDTHNRVKQNGLSPRVLHSPVSQDPQPQTLETSTAASVENKIPTGQWEKALTTDVNVIEEPQNPITPTQVTPNPFVTKSLNLKIQQTTEPPALYIANKETFSDQASEIGQGIRSRAESVDQNEWIELGTVPIKSNVVSDSTIRHQYTRSGQKATRQYQQTDNTTQNGSTTSTNNLNNPRSDGNVVKEITAQGMAKNQLITKPGANPILPQPPKMTSNGTNTYVPSRRTLENKAGMSQTNDNSTQTVPDPQVPGHPQSESPPHFAQGSNGQPSEMKNLLQMLTRLQGNINSAQTAEPVETKGNSSVDQVRGVNAADTFSRQGMTRSSDGPRQDAISRNSRPQQQQLAQHRRTILPPEGKQQLDPIRNVGHQLQQQHQHQQQQQNWQQQQRQRGHMDSRGNIHLQQQPHRLQHRQRGQQQQRVPVDSKSNDQPQQQHHHQQRDQQRVDSRRYGQRQQGKQQQRQHVQVDLGRNIQPQRQKHQQRQQLKAESGRRNFYDQQQGRYQWSRPQRQQQYQEQEHHREQHVRGEPVRRTVSSQQRESVPQKQHLIQNKQFHRESQSEQNPKRPSITFSFARTDPQTLEIGISRGDQRNMEQRPNHKRPPSHPRPDVSRGQSGFIREHIWDSRNVRSHPKDTASRYWRRARN